MMVFLLVLQLLCTIGFGVCAISVNTLSIEILFLICSGISGSSAGKTLGNLINKLLHR